MQTIWQDIINDAVGFSATIMSDFSPVIIVGLGLAVFAVFVAIMRGRS